MSISSRHVMPGYLLSHAPGLRRAVLAFLDGFNGPVKRLRIERRDHAAVYVLAGGRSSSSS